jgi:hypothetical protein
MSANQTTMMADFCKSVVPVGRIHNFNNYNNLAICWLNLKHLKTKNKNKNQLEETQKDELIKKIQLEYDSFKPLQHSASTDTVETVDFMLN